MGKLIITYGLPGSGKTTWTNKQRKRGTLKIDVDKEIKESHKSGSPKEKFLNFLKHDLDNLAYRNDRIILDGLFYCTNDIIEIIKNIDKNYIENGEIEIQYWEEDKDTCEWNDRYRREQDSINTIRNLNLEKPNINYICNYLNDNKINCKVNIIHHVITKKSKYQMFIDKYHLTNCIENYKFRSDSWITGGSWWSYTGAEGDIDPEPALLTFQKFDDLLLKINSGISFIQYKKIYNKCVSVETDTKRDYYQDINIAYYVCNIIELIDALEEYGIEVFD